MSRRVSQLARGLPSLALMLFACSACQVLGGFEAFEEDGSGSNSTSGASGKAGTSNKAGNGSGGSDGGSGGTEGEGATGNVGSAGESSSGSGGGGAVHVPTTYTTKLLSSADNPTGIATDGKSVYWCDYTAKTLETLDLSKTSPTSRATGVFGPQVRGLGGERIYIGSGSKLLHMPLSGGAAVEIEAADVYALSLDDEYLYYTYQPPQGPGAIRRRPHTGASSEDLIGMTMAAGAHAVAGGQVYFVNNNTEIRTAAADVGATTTVLYSAPLPDPLPAPHLRPSLGLLVADATHVYFTGTGDGDAYIARVDLQGENFEVIYEADAGFQPNIPSLLIEGDYLYFQDDERSGCALTKIKRLSTKTLGIDIVHPGHDCIGEIAVADEIVYFTTSDPRSGPLGVGVYQATPD
jgi:hypothetical protein